jgi:hypothetical protein
LVCPPVPCPLLPVPLPFGTGDPSRRAGEGLWGGPKDTRPSNLHTSLVAQRQRRFRSKDAECGRADRKFKRDFAYGALTNPLAAELTCHFT